jgi:hypothetical protein
MPWRPSSLKPLGEPLFTDDLLTWLDAHFDAKAEEAMCVALTKNGRLSQTATARQVRDHARLQPIELGQASYSEQRSDDQIGPDLTLTIAIPFAGDAVLFSSESPALRSRRPLHGWVQRDCVVVAMECLSTSRTLAELALTDNEALIREHVAEQGLALRIYTGELRARCRDYVRANWERHYAKRLEYRRDAMLNQTLEELLMARMREMAGDALADRSMFDVDP